MRWLLALAATLFGCSFSEDVQRDIDKYVQIAAEKEGLEASQAMQHLQKIGKRTIPTIELALQQARPAGKKNLITVLRRIGDGEVVPLLQQLAIFDPELTVRREARMTIEGWAKAPGERGDKARAALRKIDEATQRNEAG